MDPASTALLLHKSQQRLTPAQEAEAHRFAAERIRGYLTPHPVDEAEAEAFLGQAYEVAGLPAPRHHHWLDGPHQLTEHLAPALARRKEDTQGRSVQDVVLDSVRTRVEKSLKKRLENRVLASVSASVRDLLQDRVEARVGVRLKVKVYGPFSWNLRHTVRDRLRGSDLRGWWWSTFTDDLRNIDRNTVWAYDEAPWLACAQFFDAYLAPNDLHALAAFNERVAAYRLGQDTALLVRRPFRLSLDAEGWLHHETGTCLAFPDGWGFCAWHGMEVPDNIILAPEWLSRQDFLDEENVELRRVIQERMGEQFMTKLGGVVLDSGPRGTLYKVALSSYDPEPVARYVQVQDASTQRQYFLRVPPTIQTAAEAVAWSFGLSGEGYHPAQET